MMFILMTNITFSMILCELPNYHIHCRFPASQTRKEAEPVGDHRRRKSPAMERWIRQVHNNRWRVFSWHRWTLFGQGCLQDERDLSDKWIPIRRRIMPRHPW
ncbi:hypothetical protein D4N02_24730 [Klebsiella pneumoniae]|nr:hypothetical protein D4N02_24730 [Klebsiella pneumoniae]